MQSKNPGKQRHLPDSSITWGRLYPSSIASDFLQFFGQVALVCVYLFCLTVIFAIITPKNAAFSSIREWTLFLGIIPILIILAIVHLSAPTLKTHHHDWRYAVIYTFLGFLFFLYSLFLFFLYTQPSVLIIAAILAIVSWFVIPTLRLRSKTLYRSALTIGMACLLLITPNAKLRMESEFKSKFSQSPIMKMEKEADSLQSS